MNKSGTRLVHLDLLKSLAIFVVLLAHSWKYDYNFLQNESAMCYITYFIRALMSASIPIYFFVNGYLIFNKSFDLKKHVFKTVRLVVLAVVWGCITLLCLMIIRGDHLSVFEFIMGIIKWKQGWINFLWFMGAMVCIYIFFPLLKYTFDNSKSAFLCFTVVCVLMTFGNRLLNHLFIIGLNLLSLRDGMVLPMNFFNIFNPFKGMFGYTFVYFCVGGLAKLHEDKLLKISSFKRNTVSVIAIVVSCLCLSGLGVYFSHISNKLWDVTWGGFDTIFAFVSTIAIYVLSLNFKRNSRIVGLLSKNTLGIYLIHTIFIDLTIDAFEKLHLFDSLLGNAVYALFVLAISLGAVMLLRKIPVVKNLVS